MKDEITKALKALSPEKDGDWTEGGRPSLLRVQGLMKNTTITQAMLDEAAGDMQRRPAPPVVLDEVISEDGSELKNIRVKAKAEGFYGGKVRRVGEEFTFTGVIGSWMTVISEGDKKPSKK